MTDFEFLISNRSYNFDFRELNNTVHNSHVFDRVKFIKMLNN